MNNAYRRDGYVFVFWNTSDDGSGQEYHPGDTFVIKSSVVLYAQWIDANYAALDNFVSTYMHLDDYNQNLGYCTSYMGGEGYYETAKRALVVLTANQINVFRTDDRYASARARYEAWARANHDFNYAYVDDFTHISQANVNKSITNLVSDNIALLVVIGAVSISFINFTVLVLKKRKER